MSAVAIIPARGGSKRIPRKNIRDFLGKPIIAYSIEAALRSNCFDEVMVSTDDDEIAAIAKSFGAVVPFIRSAKNADDFASTVDVIVEVIENYQGLKKEFKSGCCIYPTAPLVTPSRIVDGRTQLINGKYDTVFPVTNFSYPIWRALKVSDGKVSMFWPENYTKRSQDLETAYHDAGQWYWFDCPKIIASKKIWTDNTFGLVVDETEVQDIDNESDWKTAEMKFKLLR